MLGAVLTAYLVVFSDISQTFYFNPCAFLGGVLVLGAGKRMVAPPSSRRQSIASGAMWGMGAGFLLLSRPFEGFFFCLAIVGWVIWNTPFRQTGRWRGFLLSQISALSLVAGFAAFLLYYNRAVTGDAWVFPYSLHDQRYLPFPVILWFPFANVTSWPNSALEGFYGGALAGFIKVDWQLESFTHLCAATLKKTRVLFHVLSKLGSHTRCFCWVEISVEKHGSRFVGEHGSRRTICDCFYFLLGWQLWNSSDRATRSVFSVGISLPF
jgi:hypothetical protein